MDEGSCQHHSLLWYFHSPTNSCRPFLFGGCRGNGNRFPSRRECQRRCQASTGETPNSPFVQPGARPEQEIPARICPFPFLQGAPLGSCGIFFPSHSQELLDVNPMGGMGMDPPGHQVLMFWAFQGVKLVGIWEFVPSKPWNVPSKHILESSASRQNLEFNPDQFRKFHGWDWYGSTWTPGPDILGFPGFLGLPKE
ncbi:hypothetical protein HGM15179_012580 [Zosterops borbonicus]|uniref:BPTI/Kunitz inhibitor domain-containing protein n=1 Tax=Zosterops borbonicus TaxID=364589 RepID=A0A8K1LI68_9PASS|nr:hypothetical protein HGM15179_012580 [Zosterops borbonicus]